MLAVVEVVDHLLEGICGGRFHDIGRIEQAAQLGVQRFRRAGMHTRLFRPGQLRCPARVGACLHRSQ